MSLVDEIVQLTITVQDAALTADGFGTPLIMAHHSVYGPELVRSYSSTTAMTDDGFAATDPAVLTAAKIFSQNPKVSSIKVGKRSSTPSAQSIVMTVDSAVNGQLYTVNINGTDFDFTAVTAVAADIAAGLVSAINLGAEPVTATDNLDGTFDLDADVAGDIFTLAVNSRTLLQYNDQTADAGIAADYAAIKSEDSDFYGVLLEYCATAEVTALAAAVEADRKLFLAETADQSTLDADSGCLGEVLSLAGYHRTSLIWSGSPQDSAGSAWMGNRFPSDPGSSTWAFKSLAGVTVDTLTDTERGNLEGNSVNYYVQAKGLSLTIGGYAASGRFLDITRGIDWLFSRLQERILSLLANTEKVPYTDAGVALVENSVRAQLREAVSQGVLAGDPEPTVSTPLVASVSSVDRANRLLPDVTFSGQLAGAIHSIEIDGTVSV